MTPLTQQDVLAHEAQVPWPEIVQVERECLADRVGFCSEMGKLLRRDLAYDPQPA
jgi:hypothetical protein